VELQQNLDAIRKQGLGVAAISYDSTGVLKSFANRQHIAYPLLSDPDSKIIRAFDILNETAKPGTLTYGIPYPGVYIVDVQGKVVSKYFEEDYKDRVSTADILARQYGAPVAAAENLKETAHLNLMTAASNDLARPGLRIALILDIALKPGMHLYAPGVQGYIPIDWNLEDGGPAAKRHPFEYPPSEMLRLEAIGETVPVYRGHFKIVREITFGQEDALKTLVTPSGELIIRGSFRYQACDDHKCYLPQDLPLEWRFKYQGLDRERAPAEFQRKPN
jgi:AhpC/TSA family/Disulphide bond corrector protein DsbC